LPNRLEIQGVEIIIPIATELDFIL
jgi:hypothetical protein